MLKLNQLLWQHQVPETQSTGVVVSYEDVNSQDAKQGAVPSNQPMAIPKFKPHEAKVRKRFANLQSRIASTKKREFGRSRTYKQVLLNQPGTQTQTMGFISRKTGQTAMRSQAKRQIEWEDNAAIVALETQSLPASQNNPNPSSGTKRKRKFLHDHSPHQSDSFSTPPQEKS
eukprot:TRINITY_DN33337_c0_g1_i2.p2 TRINITY_DN33337_c0_g1~~TRINITY_DN33337_c0_g1_i2.p2  ORF type:complete len:172 (+),score=25.18 TRINITY_DN33337_c0_g1_i2:468-983(+)